MGVNITKLIWDKWNTNHISKHKVTPAEAEESLTDKHVVFLVGYSNRVLSLGRSGKRLLTIVLQQQKSKTHYYVVTARDMAIKEREIYRIENKIKEKRNEK